jgi:hypothetical protein
MKTIFKTAIGLWFAYELLAAIIGLFSSPPIEGPAAIGVGVYQVLLIIFIAVYFLASWLLDLSKSNKNFSKIGKIVCSIASFGMLAVLGLILAYLLIPTTDFDLLKRSVQKVRAERAINPPKRIQYRGSNQPSPIVNTANSVEPSRNDR